MKKESQKRVIRAMDAVWERLILTSLAELPNVNPSELSQARAVAFRQWKQSRERRLLVREAARSAEPDMQTLENALKALEERVTLVQKGIEDALRKAARRRGPQPVPREKQADICAQIMGLHRDRRKPIREAVETVKEQYPLSERTIYRIWRRRSELLKPAQQENAQ